MPKTKQHEKKSEKLFIEASPYYPVRKKQTKFAQKDTKQKKLLTNKNLIL